MTKLIKCPHCGSASGVCSEFKVSGMEYFKFSGLHDGEEITGPYEHTKYVECIDCGKRIMTYEEFAENYTIFAICMIAVINANLMISH